MVNLIDIPLLLSLISAAYAQTYVVDDTGANPVCRQTSDNQIADNDLCCQAADKDADGDETLLVFCSMEMSEMVMMNEVYETQSDLCDTVTLERIVYKTSDGGLGTVRYVSDHVDSTPLRCCINFEDF